MSKTDPEFQKKRGTFFGSNKRGPKFDNQKIFPFSLSESAYDCT
jgi:hypothetical protein